jgi:hypothetical protein
MDVWPVIRRTKAADVREVDRKRLTGVDSGKNIVAMRGRARGGGASCHFDLDLGVYPAKRDEKFASASASASASPIIIIIENEWILDQHTLRATESVVCLDG